MNILAFLSTFVVYGVYKVKIINHKVFCCPRTSAVLLVNSSNSFGLRSTHSHLTDLADREEKDEITEVRKAVL